MSEHTPGPWRVETLNGLFTDRIRGYTVVDDNGDEVLGSMDSKSNAELIARAPQLEADLAAVVQARDAALRLLRESAPKCDECGEIATWSFNDDGFILYHCGRHTNEFTHIVGEPFDLGRRIAAMLAGQPVADAEREALRAALAMGYPGRGTPGTNYPDAQTFLRDVAEYIEEVGGRCAYSIGLRARADAEEAALAVRS